MSATGKSVDKAPKTAGFLRRLREDEAGNTALLMAAGVLPLLALVGGSVDVGRQYMTQARLQQACDAGALAARRVMANPATLTTSDRDTGYKFFDFNFPQNSFGSTTLTRSYAKGSVDGTVNGSATAVVPTSIMHIFGIASNSITVNCNSTLNVPNSDVMFVLDVTGSMASTTSDGISKIDGLKDAVKDFYTALGPGTSNSGRIRYGFVPYSSTVNVGHLLQPDWLVGGTANETWTYQSREAIYTDVYVPNTFSSESAATTGSTTFSRVPSTYTNVASDLTVAGVTYRRELNSTTTPAITSSSQCAALATPFSSLTLTGSPTTTLVSQTTPTVANPIITRTYDIRQGYSMGTFYRYSWSNSRCRLQSGTVTQSGTRTIRSTTTQTVTSWTSVNEFDKWLYKPREIDVSNYVDGTAIANPAYDSNEPDDSDGNEAPATVTWAGCIEEADTDDTIDASADINIPTAAYDLQIDHVPAADNQKWRPLWPEVEYWRFSDASRTAYTSDASDFGENVKPNASGDVAACPAKARKLASYAAATAGPTGDTTGLSSFNAYVDSLQPTGCTYHDIGMVWGARLLSPNGIFGGENTNAPNGFPINRHIVFMTDGYMTTRGNNYDAWGMNMYDQRVASGGTNNSTLTDIHNQRYLMLCNAAKAKGYTIWVVGFGITTLSSEMAACATDADHASVSNSSSSLQQRFQTIAQSIGGLRLSQ
jgi:Flp pilus assembly protein TadG